jgi:hypothetical protein
MNEQPDNALRWAAVFCVTGVTIEVQFTGPLESFAHRVRANGYIQSPGVYVSAPHIIAIVEIPGPSARPGVIHPTISSPAEGQA